MLQAAVYCLEQWSTAGNAHCVSHFQLIACDMPQAPSKIPLVTCLATQVRH